MKKEKHEQNYLNYIYVYIISVSELKSIYSTMLDVRGRVERQSRLILDLKGEITKLKTVERKRQDKYMDMSMEADESFKLNLPMDSIDQMMELEEAIKEDFSKENLLVGKMCTNKR